MAPDAPKARQLRAIRGMHDILPPHSADWQSLEDQIRAVLERYGYRQLRTPLVEVTELFQRSIGEVTDIVAKEMYSFADRGGDHLSLRPEGTASCVRAAIEHGLLDQAQRLWYLGPMFRRERPQRGRYRQFHQIGVEVFALPGPDIDLEVILLTRRLWAALGIEGLQLEINSLGDNAERAIYRERLQAYLHTHVDALDADSRQRLGSNPLRILDSKNPHLAEIIAGAPSLIEHLGPDSRAHFEALCTGLERAGVAYRINPRLVRGLDYYNRTVFEWISTDLGAQGTVCAGGRYDGLIAQLGGPPTPAVGFAMGLERLLELLPPRPTPGPDAYLVAFGAAAEAAAMHIAEQVRSALPELRLVCHCGGGSAKAQFKRADRSGARVALVLGETELTSGSIGIKPLRGDGAQQVCALADLPVRLPALLRTVDAAPQPASD